MDKIEIPALLQNIDKMIDFVMEAARKQGFNQESLSQIRLASEEALVNIINYAYPDKEENIQIICTPVLEGGIIIEVSDTGLPFDPLSLKDPDITLPMEQRKIGGLGIFMIRKIMDDVKYRRDNDRNILTMVKFKK